MNHWPGISYLNQIVGATQFKLQTAHTRLSARGWIIPPMYETIRAKSVNDDLPQQSLHSKREPLSRNSSFLSSYRAAAIESSIFLTYVRFRFDAYQQYCVKSCKIGRTSLSPASIGTKANFRDFRRDF